MISSERITRMSIKDIRDSTELYDVARLFFGDDTPDIAIAETARVYDIVIDGNKYTFSYRNSEQSAMPIAHADGRLAKIALYDALNAHTGREMPWGALTGVRPTKLFYEALATGYSTDQATEIMRSVYRVRADRAEVLRQIVDAQRGKIFYPSDYINLYVHVPYCTTRCTYCSFISAPISKRTAQAERYTELLCDEIKRSIALLRENEKHILSVYIGGGTPTALDDALFEKLLDSIGAVDCEYTCEAGRPDTITASKADIMKSHNVTRVCVNPQTLNDGTLTAIGRSHTARDFFDAYELVKNRGFDINCDLIAGLDCETESDFINSFEGIKALKPQNITVHSLAKKNGSVIRYEAGENSAAAAMTAYALSHLGEYRPYYLYRQKRQACNLENVGFSIAGKECVNNITTMEETVGVMACGAGAISKRVDGGGISRFANMRDIALYIERYDEKLRAKLDYFS